ncbi:uncharacterized protein JCM6883_004213 [Sporobolomyces salmoneus]|uniref:uncharacterized protein n=1 Tax=Sporobolomyces salmoneus TaxID=183962 RepID=UPI0031808DA7
MDIHHHEAVPLSRVASLLEKAFRKICHITSFRAPGQPKLDIFKGGEYHCREGDLVYEGVHEKHGFTFHIYNVPAVVMRGILNVWQLPTPVWAVWDRATRSASDFPSNGFKLQDIAGPSLATVMTSEGMPRGGFADSNGMNYFFFDLRCTVKVEENEGNFRHQFLLTQYDALNALNRPDDNSFDVPLSPRFQGQYRKYEIETGREVENSKTFFLFTATIREKTTTRSRATSPSSRRPPQSTSSPFAVQSRRPA